MKNLFAEYDQIVAQVLLTKEKFSSIFSIYKFAQRFDALLSMGGNSYHQ